MLHSEGEDGHSCSVLNSKFRGTQKETTLRHGLRYALIADILCEFDVREQFVLENNLYGNESALGSDPCENCFSYLTSSVGYNPTAKQCLDKLQEAEDEMLCRLHPDFTMKEQPRVHRQTMLQDMQRRIEWNDGQRLPWWWQKEAFVPDDPALQSAKVSRSHKRSRDARRISEGKRSKVRDFYAMKKENTAANVV